MTSKQEKKEADPSKTFTGIMTERELKDMLSKGVKQTDSEERLNQFVRWRIQEYTLHKWNNLSEIFAEEFTQQSKFQHFVKEDFEKLSKDNICHLRDCLRINGVYVQKVKEISVAQALANVVQEDIPWPPDDEERPSSKQSQSYPPQQQPIQSFQPVQQQQPYRPENTAPLPPQPAYQPENSAPILPPPAPSQPENTAPILLPPTPNTYQVIQNFGIKQQIIAEDSSKSTTKKRRRKKKKKSIASSSSVDTSQLSAVSRPRTISTLGEPSFSLSTARTHASNLAPLFTSQHTPNLAPLFASQHAHYLASWLVSQLGYIRDAEEMEATGQR